MGKTIVEADLVAATARNPETLKELEEKFPEQLLTLQFDVQVREQIYATVEETVKHFGRIDVLMNNAGFRK